VTLASSLLVVETGVSAETAIEQLRVRMPRIKNRTTQLPDENGIGQSILH